jgi:pilus biogenesis lipoprotein CpaD
MKTRAHRSAPWGSKFALLCLAVMMAGCSASQQARNNYLDDDMRERHVVRPQTVVQHLNVQPIGPQHDRLNQADADRIKAFVQSYQSKGLDDLKISYSGSQAAQPAINALLKKANIHNVAVISGSSSGGHEIVLSYSAIQPVLVGDCQGSRTQGGDTFSVPNKTMGCSVTTAFAQQVDNPRDLIEPRAVEKKFYTVKETSKDKDK